MTFTSMRHRVAFDWGTRLLHKERWRPAAFLLGHAARLGPNHWEASNNLAIALLKMERWEAAAQVAERATQLDPNAVESHDLLGMALLQLDRWEDAAATYRRALTVDPDRYDLYDRLGMALWRLERWDEVVQAYEAALKLDDGRYTAHHRLGVAQLQLGRWDGEAALRRAIQLAGDDPAAASDLNSMKMSLVDAEARRDAAGIPVSLTRSPAERWADFWTPDNLGPDVFVAERWLESITAVPDEVPPGPRLLFVLDNDFGELATVKFFVLGQELAGRSTLLLPERLYVHNVDALPGRTHQYGSVDDVLEVVDRERSEVVFLCSGYVFSEHFDFSGDDVARLVAGLRERGSLVVTADPYVGMLSKQDPSTLVSFEFLPEESLRYLAEKFGPEIGTDPEMIARVVESRRAAEAKAWALLRRSEETFRDTYHLYPSYCDVAEDDLVPTDARNVSFFNEGLLRPAPSPPDESVSPHWLFILGGPDCDLQAVAEGEEKFEEIVANKLVETLEAGRHPILIGPRKFVDKLLERMPTTEGIDILSQCPFDQFYALLLSAEHVFYWNMVSHSLLIRLYNQLPIVQFGLGHLIQVAPPIYDRIVGWYYQGWEPPLRDHHERLTAATVEGWAEEYRLEAGRLAERYRRAPSPDGMVTDLLQRPPTVEL